MVFNALEILAPNAGPTLRVDRLSSREIGQRRGGLKSAWRPDFISPDYGARIALMRHIIFLEVEPFVLYDN